MKKSYLIGAIVIIALVILALLAQIVRLSSAPTPQIPVTEQTQPASNKVFDIKAGSFYFTPTELRVKRGDKVTINVTNDGGFHNLTIDAFNVKIGPITTIGQKASAEFMADKAGTFEFYCNVGTHRQKGQKGLLIVE